MIADTDLVRIAREQYRNDRNHNSEWKKRARICYDYYAGRQWPDDIKTQLEASGRSATVMNRIKPRVSAVVGMEISNRQEIRYAPREIIDEAITDLVNKASEWTRDQAGTEDHETEQFQDMVITGMGWSETRMSYEDNLDGIADTRRISPLQMDWDKESRLANLADRQHQFFSDDISPSGYKAMFPGMEDKASGGALGVTDLWENAGKPHDATYQDFYPEEATSATADIDKMKKVRVVCYEYFDYEPIWRVMAPDGSIRRVKPDEADQLKRDMEAQGRSVRFEEFDRKAPRMASETDGDGTIVLPYVKQQERRFYRAWFSGENILEHEEAPCPYGFSFNCMTGWRDETRNYWFGMVEGLIDPQMWSNKFFSQAIYIYTVNPKGGVMYEKDAVDNPAEFQAKYASPDSALEVRPGAISGNKILERQAKSYPSDLDKLSAFAIDSLPALDGLNPEVLGMAGRDQPGLLEKMRKQAGMTILAPLFDARRRYHKIQGRVLLHFISQYFTDGQLAKITGGQVDPQLVQQFRKQDMRDYDVIVDDAPNSPNMKEYVLNILMQVVQQAPQAMTLLAPIMVKYTPLPLDAQQEIMQALAQGSNVTNDPQFQAMAKEAQRLMQENARLKIGRDVKMAQLQVRQQADQQKVGLKVQETQMKAQLSMEELKAEIALERQKMMLEMKLELAKMLGEMGLKHMEVQLNHEADMEAAKHKGSNGNA